MERVTGIGGVFFKAKDPEKLKAWYAEKLGVKIEDYGGCAFNWSEDPTPHGMTIWSIFPAEAETDYFAPSQAGFMVNFRVKDLDAMMAQLVSAGVEQVGQIENIEYGRFGWVLDPEGNKIELWQPPEKMPEG
jgi:predicted enzyme related to lactoylglutathione lyase